MNIKDAYHGNPNPFASELFGFESNDDDSNDYEITSVELNAKLDIILAKLDRIESREKREYEIPMMFEGLL